MIQRANRVYEILCGGKFEFHASTGDLNWIIYICLPWFIVIFQLITGFASAFVHSIPLFAVLRFMVGFGLTGVMLSLYIYGMELVGPNSRTAAGNITYFYYNGFQMLFVLIAYLERDWRNLSLIATVPATLLFPFWKYVHNDNVFLLSLSLSCFFVDWLTLWQTRWLADSLVGWLTEWLTHWLTEWLARSLTDRFTGSLTNWQIDWPIGWLIGRLICWLTNWLTDYLTYRLIDWLADW